MPTSALTPISNRRFDSQNLRISYFNPLVLPDLTASVDSVRIKYTYRKSTYIHDLAKCVDTLTVLLHELTSDLLFCEFPMDVRHKEVNFRIGCYSHTLVYTLPDGSSFAVLVGRYTYEACEKGLACEIVIDFNPNKTMGRGLKRIFGILSSLAVDVTVQRFDLAMDFFVQRDTLSLVRRPGSGYQKFVDDKGIITEYTGKRSHHSAIKLYDKGAEVGLSYPVTRLEITLDWSRFSSVIVLMPTILSTAPLEFNLGFDSLPFPVKAVLIHPDLYDILKQSVAPNTWTKYKGIIQNNGQVNFSVPVDTLKRIDTYICKYIAELPKIHLMEEKL